jgi:hypothetical protein
MMGMVGWGLDFWMLGFFNPTYDFLVNWMAVGFLNVWFF